MFTPVAIGIALLAASTAPAADAPPREVTELTLAELSAVKVTTVSRRPEERFTSTAAVFVITREEVRRSGARTLPELLRRVPGVDVARVDASQWAVGIRGFTSTLSRAQLVLIDGRSVYNPLFAGTYWDAQDLLLEDVERVEVVRGPGGSLWGANAVNGIVNVITTAAGDSQGGYLAAGAGNEESAFAEARYGAKLGRRGHYRAWARYFARDGQHHAGGEPWDDWSTTRGGGRVDLDLSGGAALSLAGGLYSGSAGRRAVVAAYEAPFARVLIADGHLRGAHLRAAWSGPAASAGRWSAQAYYDRTERTEPNFAEDRDSFDLDAQYQRPWGGRHALVAGASARFSHSSTSGPPTVAFEPPDHDGAILGAFLEDTVERAPLRLSAGLKLERNPYSGLEWQPSLRLGYAPGTRHFLWAAASRTVRTPSRLERDLSLTSAASATQPLFTRLLGSAQFESERALVYEAGYRLRLAERLTADLAAFHSRYPNLTSLERGATFAESGRTVVPFTFGNGLQARVSGAELAVDFRPGGRWLLRGTHALLDTWMRAKPGSRDTTSAAGAHAVPRHTSTASAAGALPFGLQLDATLRRVGARSSRGIPAYTQAGLRLAWPAGEHLELALTGLDLLSPHHAEFSRDIAVERSIYGEARVRW